MEADGDVDGARASAGTAAVGARGQFFCLSVFLSLTFYLIAKDAPRAVDDVIDASLDVVVVEGGGADDGAGDDGVSHADGVGHESDGARAHGDALERGTRFALGIETLKRDASDEIEGAA